MIESIIAVVGGFLATSAILGLRKVGATLFVQKYGTIINKVYEVVDPIAGQVIKSYGGSEVQQALQLAVARVADNNLDEADIVEITNYVIAKFNPALAAAKTIDYSSEEGKASMELVKSLQALRDGASFDEILTVAKNAKALI